MKYVFCAAFLAVSAQALAGDYGSATASRIVSVHDGDTFAVDIDGWPAIVGKHMPVRVRGIDAPELHGRCDAETRGAVVARDHLAARLTAANTVELLHLGRDKNFRLDASVLIDGQDVGAEMLAKGLARPYDGGTKSGWCGR